MKKWIIAAIALIIIGAVAFYAAAASMDFDLQKLDNGKYETNTVVIEDSFQNISLDADDETVSLKPSEDGKCSVVFVEEVHHKHEASVTNGTLTIRPKDGRKPIQYFGVYARNTEITIYLPNASYSDLVIDSDTADIQIPAEFTFQNIHIDGDDADVTCAASAGGIQIDVDSGNLSLTGITANAIDLATDSGDIRAESLQCQEDVIIHGDTGNVYLKDVSCRGLTAELYDGDITLDNVIAAEAFSIETDSGDVQFMASDAGSVSVRTDSGNVTGSLLSGKDFSAETDSGNVNVPAGVTGGRCEIHTDSGDISIEIPNS